MYRMVTRPSDLLVLLGVFGLIWLVFSLFSYPEDPQLISIHKEEKLGEVYVDLILLNPVFGEFDNSRVDSAVRVIADRLEEGLEDSEYNYHFVVFDSEMINAFTVPGGNILISTGLLTSTSFDRKQEEEADLFAAKLLETASIEPRYLATLFRKLEEEMDNELIQHFEIISTHPNFHSRIREALSFKPAKDFEAEPIDLDWELIRAEL